MRFEVEPQALTGQAPVISRQSGQLVELAGEIRGLAGVAGAHQARQRTPGRYPGRRRATAPEAGG
jgi:hypothetical protein